MLAILDGLGSALGVEMSVEALAGNVSLVACGQACQGFGRRLLCRGLGGAGPTARQRQDRDCCEYDQRQRVASLSHKGLLVAERVTSGNFKRIGSGCKIMGGCRKNDRSV